MARSIGVAFTLVALALVGCSKPSNPDNTPSQPASQPAPNTQTTSAGNDNAGSTGGGGGEATAQAETIFKSRCSTCHGMNGKGDGPAAITLNPKPRNYTDANWQKSVTDEQIAQTIVKGGAAMGKSPLMAPNPDLADKPAVVDALVKKVRSFAGK